jgi:hypothetical protein
MSEIDDLLSEAKKKQTLDLQPYSVWSEANKIEDPLESRKAFGDYVRTTYSNSGLYNKEVETEVRQGLYESAVKAKLIDPADESATKRLFAATDVPLDVKVNDALGTLNEKSPDYEEIAKYKSLSDQLASNPEDEALKSSIGEAQYAAELAVNRSRNDVLRTQIKNNQIPFAKVVNPDGTSEVLASDLAAKMPLMEAIAASKKAGAGIQLSDTLDAQYQLSTPEGLSLPVYKTRRITEAAAMINALTQSDDNVKADIESVAKYFAHKEYGFGDYVSETFNDAGQVVSDVVGYAIGRGADIRKRKKFDAKVEAESKKGFADNVYSITQKLNSSGAVTEGDAFTYDEVSKGLTELALNKASTNGYFKTYDGEDIGKNIRNYGLGLPQVSASVMANKELFDQALAKRDDIAAGTKKQMEAYRQVFVKDQFQNYNELLQRTSVGEDWLDELHKGRIQGQEDSVTLEKFLGNKNNYSEFSQRAAGVGWSIVNGFGQLLAAIPAGLGMESAQNYLANVAQETSDRQELGKLFGVKMGVGQELAEAVAPMLVDMAATTLLAAATAPIGGVGGAMYLASKQGARLTVKGLVKGLVSGALRPLAGELENVTAKRLITEGLIKQSIKDTGTQGAMAVVKGYSELIASKFVTVPATFIPAATRAMGSTYGTLFNELKKDKTLTREEAHDRALGGALASGVVTGVITSAFGAFGHGGLDNALTSGLTMKEMKVIFSRLLNSTEEISDKVFGDVIKSSLKTTFKNYGYKSLGKEIAKSSFDEGVEEGLNQFLDTFIQDASLNQNTPMMERLNQSFHAFMIGGAMGAAVPAIRSNLPSFSKETRNARARNLEEKAFTDIANRLNESGSPLTADIVKSLLTGSVRKREYIANRIQEVKKASDAATESANALKQLQVDYDIANKTDDELSQIADEAQRTTASNARIEAARRVFGALQKGDTVVDGSGNVKTISDIDHIANTVVFDDSPDVIPEAHTVFASSTATAEDGTQTSVVGFKPTRLETAAPVSEEVNQAAVKEVIDGLANVTPEAVDELMPLVRPEEVKGSWQMDLGMYVPQEYTSIDSGAINGGTITINVGSPDFGQIKPVMERIGLDFNDVLQSELSEVASKPTLIPKVILPDINADTDVPLMEASAEQFAGDQPMREAEAGAFNRILRIGFPISFQASARYGMPSRNISEKATGQKSYYSNKSNELTSLVYANFPLVQTAVPAGGKPYVSQRKITYVDPVSGKRVSNQITGVVDSNGVGVFNNDPVLIAEMLRDGVPVRIPSDFDGRHNPSFVIRNKRVIDVLGPRPDGKAGLISMTAPIERSLTSEPDYQSLYEASNLATLFLDDTNQERAIASGAQVLDPSGRVTNIGGQPTSVGEVINGFNLFMLSATMPEVQEGARALGINNERRAYANKALREFLKLRNGAELELGFFETALQALHTEYLYHVNLFEIRSSFIASNIAVATPTGFKIDPAKSKAAIKQFSSRLKADKKTTIAERLSPFVDTNAAAIRDNPDKVILSFIDSMVLNNPRFEGNTMPTINQLSDTIKGRYAEQQETRRVEEKVKATMSMDPAIMDQIEFESVSNEANYIGEPSIIGSERMTPQEVSSILKQAEFNALNAIDEDPALRDALNDLLFQSVYANPSPTQVTRVTGMTTADAFGTLSNWIAKGNFNHPEILKFERSLRSGEFVSGNDLRSALTLSRITSRASEFSNPTDDAEYVAAVRSELSRSLGKDVTAEHAKSFIKAIDKSIKKRMSRSHITRAQVQVANRLNSIEAARLALVSGDPQSVIDALKVLAESTKKQDAAQRLVAQLLLEDPNFIKSIKFEIGEAEHSFAGEYNKLSDGTHSVFINLNGFNGRGLTNVLLEEYVHAFISDTITKPSEALTEAQRMALKRLNGLLELVRKQAKIDGITDPSLLDGLENLDEFVASFLLSKNFQSLVKFTTSPTGQRGFFARIIDAMVNLFRRVTLKEKDAYTQAFEDIVDLSRSAMPSERNTTASLFASVAEDASDILNRAVDARESLPTEFYEGVNWGRRPEMYTNITPTEETSSVEEQQVVNEEIKQQAEVAAEEAQAILVEDQQRVTEENVPKSPTTTNKAQLEKARSIMALIRSIIPSEVRLKFVTSKDEAAMGEERRFVASATGDEVTVNMSRLLPFIEGLDSLTSGMLVESIVSEELGHVASYNALSQTSIDEIANSFTQSELDNIADGYYQYDADRANSKALLRSEDPQVALQEKRRLTEEHLRGHLQKVTTGHTTEETAAFLRTNPSLFKIALRYIGGVFRTMVSRRSVATLTMQSGSTTTTITNNNSRTGNPLVDIALSRMLTEMRALKMGYRNGPSVLQFDPANPTASLEAYRVISGLDNLDNIEATGFDEDVAEALYSQISLNDFRRIQQASRGIDTEEKQTVTAKIKVSDIVSYIKTTYGLEWRGVVKSLVDDFEMAYVFEEKGGEYIARPAFELQSIPTFRGDPADPEEVEYNAAKAFLNKRLSTIVKTALANSEVAVEPILVDRFIESFIEEILINVGDLGSGVQLILDSNYDMENEETVLNVSAELGAIDRSEINLDKLRETLLQIDGLRIESEDVRWNGSKRFNLVLVRGAKAYTMDFDIDNKTKNIHVGSLFPISGGEVASSDSFGMELLLALISNNHLIGAKSLDTYAAGSAQEVNKTAQESLQARQQALAEGREYYGSGGYTFKGFKAWPKIGFDYEIDTYELPRLARLLPEAEQEDFIKEFTQLATDKDGTMSLTQLMHLGENPTRGTVIWSNYGSGKNMVFDLRAGSRSLQAFGNMIERAVKLKGTVEEIKPLRQTYAKAIKGLSTLDISEDERAIKEQEIRSRFVEALNNLDINPDRLLTSLGSGTAFSGSTINYDALLETLEIPLFEAGAYKAPQGKFMRAIVGELDPRITKLDDNRKAFTRAAALLVTNYKAKLDNLVESRYGSFANAPVDIIATAMGTTGVEIDESVYERIEDAHTQRLLDARNNTALTEEERSAAVYTSADLRNEDLAQARTNARDIAVRRKNEAMTQLTAQAPDIAKHIADLRDKLIDPLSKRLKQDYGLTEDLGVYIDSQLGIYMTRAYRMFNEVGYAERVKNDPTYAAVRDKAISFFEREFVKQEKTRLQREGMLPAEAEQLAKDALLNKRSSNGESYGQQALASFIEGYASRNEAGIGGASFGEGYRVMMNNLKEKKDIPSELRDVLGEYKNSEEGTNNLLRTFTTVATMAANQSFLNNIKTLGVKNGFLITSEEYHKNPSNYEGFVPFRATKTSKYDPLLGMFAPKEMVEGFQMTFDANTIRRNTNSSVGIIDGLMTTLNKATGYAMAAKTLGSIGFYLRNVVSNTLFFGPAQGFGRIDNMLKVAAEQSWKSLKDQNRVDSYIAELTALNIIGNEIQTSIMKSLLNGKVDPDGIMKQLNTLMENSKLSKGAEAVALVVDKAGRLAAHADAIYKIAYFEHELRILKEAQAASNTGSIANLSEYQLKRMAADKVLMTAQSASQTPPIISAITKSGLGLQFAPFIRFKAEIPRILINTYKLAIKEMKDANPKIKTRGAQRFASMSGMLAVSSAIPTALRVLVSQIGDDEDESLRNSIPEFLRGHTFYYFGKGKTLKSLDLSFINPFSLIVDPVLRSFEQISRGNFGEAASKFVQGLIFDSYLDDQILAGAVVDLKSNTNSSTGEPIWEKDIDDVGAVIFKQLTYLADKAYSPRILSDALKAYDATGGDYTKFDDSPIGIMLSGVYPVRLHNIELDKQFGRYLREKREQFDRVTKRKYAVYSERPVTDKDVRKLYDDEVKNRKLMNADLAKIARGFEGLGMSKADVYNTMVERGGVSKRRAGLLLNSNLMDRPDLNKAFLQGLLEKDFGRERAKTLIDQMDKYPRYMFVEDK